MERQAPDEQARLDCRTVIRDGRHRHAQQHADDATEEAERQALAQEEAHHLS